VCSWQARPEPFGSPLVAALIRRGHEVTGTTRSPERARALEAAGARAAVVDALDASAVKRAVAEAGPEVVVHELTAIPPEFNPRRFDQAFAQTNRLRTEGTDHLIAAAEAAGVRQGGLGSCQRCPRPAWLVTRDNSTSRRASLGRGSSRRHIGGEGHDR
jgi:putative NADH-flavin reductase